MPCAGMTRATPIEGPKPSTHPQETSTSWRRSLYKSLDGASAKCTSDWSPFWGSKTFQPSGMAPRLRSWPVVVPPATQRTMRETARPTPMLGLPWPPGPIAQGIEQRFPKPCVASSNLAGAATKKKVPARGDGAGTCLIIGRLCRSCHPRGRQAVTSFRLRHPLAGRLLVPSTSRCREP